MSEGSGCRIAWQGQGLELFILTGTWEVEPSEAASRPRSRCPESWGLLSRAVRSSSALLPENACLRVHHTVWRMGRWTTGRHSGTQGCERGPGSEAGVSLQEPKGVGGGAAQKPPSHPHGGPQLTARVPEEAENRSWASHPVSLEGHVRELLTPSFSSIPWSPEPVRGQATASAFSLWPLLSLHEALLPAQGRLPPAQPTMVPALDSAWKRGGNCVRASQGDLCASLL